MKPKILLVILYLSTAVAIWWLFVVSMQANKLNFVLFFAGPAVFAAAYARSLFDPSAESNRRVRALALNGCAAAAIAVLSWLRLAPFLLRLEKGFPFVFAVVIGVVFPQTLFVLACVAIFSKHRHSSLLGDLAALVAWPYFAYFILGSRLVTYWTDPLDVLRLLAAFISLFMFVFAAMALRYRTRAAYSLGLAAGLFVLVWLAGTELMASPWANSWIEFNAPDASWPFPILLAKVKIVTAALVIAAVACSVLRLFPERWVLRKRPLRERTWAGLAVPALAVAAWFGWAVRPYRLPGMITPSYVPELRILHVEKLGLQFHETLVTASRYGRFDVSRNDRRLFQYRFRESSSQGWLPRTVIDRVMTLENSPQLRTLRTPPANALRSWNAEGWYVCLGRAHILAFSSNYGTAPPQEVVELFHKLEGLTPARTEQRNVRDVCLGFCYDPLAGLGFRYANERCFSSPTGVLCW